jgi:hypothetical protein
LKYCATVNGNITLFLKALRMSISPLVRRGGIRDLRSQYERRILRLRRVRRQWELEPSNRSQPHCQVSEDCPHHE